MKWLKLSWILLIPVVMVVLYHYGMPHSTQSGKHETTIIIPSEKITSATLTGPTLADLPEGVEGCGPVWFTSQGEAFIWTWVEQRSSFPVGCLEWKVKHINGVWYARYPRPGSPGDGTVTGYRSLEIADGVPVILDKHYTIQQN
jgi:hypothetical protein